MDDFDKIEFLITQLEDKFQCNFFERFPDLEIVYNRVHEYRTDPQFLVFKLEDILGGVI